MLAFLRTVSLFAILLSLLRLLLPKGAGQRAAELACGAALAAVLLSPLRGLTAEDAAAALRSFLPEGSPVSQTELQIDILSEQTAAYIESRADELGCPCHAEVTLVPAEGGYAVASVRLTAEQALPDTLAETVARELGCEKERISCALS